MLSEQHSSYCGAFEVEAGGQQMRYGPESYWKHMSDKIPKYITQLPFKSPFSHWYRYILHIVQQEEIAKDMLNR